MLERSENLDQIDQTQEHYKGVPVTELIGRDNQPII